MLASGSAFLPPKHYCRYWLECCTDGMVIGPLPRPDRDNMLFNITWEGHCDNMVGLEQGTRIQQWQPFYNGGSWIHYDVPMYQSCFETKGIQMSARSCDLWCATFDNCGECSAQLDCQWVGGACAMIHQYAASGTAFHENRCCSDCAAITDSNECINQKGCGWAPFENTCVSGTPDFPCGIYTVIQWEPPSHCYAVSWNEKRAFASFTLTEQQGIIAVTQYPEDHPKIVDAVASCQPGQQTGGQPMLNPVGDTTHGPLDHVTYTNGQHTEFLWGANPGATYVTTAHSYGPPGTYSHDAHSDYLADAAKQLQEHNDWIASGLGRRRKLNFDDDDGLRRPWPHLIDSTIRTPDYWSRTGATSCVDPTSLLVNGSEVFYGYNYPNAFSSNTGDENSGSVVMFLIVDSLGDVYMIMTIDAAHDGSGGFLQLDIDSTGGVGHGFDPVKFMGPPHDHLTNGGVAEPSRDTRDGYTPGVIDSWNQYSNGSISFGWDACCSDGMIFGPFPKTEWSLNMKVVTKETRGLEDVHVGTYDAEKNDIGYLTIPIKKATTAWGGVQLDATDCTTYCQRYTDCSVCGRDPACQFAPNNGGCVAAAAYVYDFGCPRPAYPLITRFISRNDDAYIREAAIDGYDSSVLLRVTLDRVDFTCPCDEVYRISVAIYSAAMSPVIVLEDIRPRIGHRHTFVDLPGLQNNTVYNIHSFLCFKQGTLGRDACSPVKVDSYRLILPSNAYPPPSAPPTAPAAGRRRR